jgi:dTDP-glucose pyrophosphorylase
MKIIITMAGEGSRFKKVGYKVPKHEIVVKGKSLFEWSMLSLSDLLTESFIFIVRKHSYQKRELETLIAKVGIKDYQILEINELTDGQASTAILANSCISDEEDVLIFNIDTFVELGEIKKTDFYGVDGLIHVFNAPGDKWSFAKVDEIGRVIQVSEKVRISDLASIGLYYFKNWNMFKEVYLNHLDDIKEEYNEAYIAPMYYYLLSDYNVRTEMIPYEKVHILGTPEDLDEFMKKSLYK